MTTAAARRWARDLALGVRLAITGAPLRTALTAVGIAFAVALLLAGASVPSLSDARDQRTSSRDDDPIPAPVVERGDATLRIAVANTQLGDQAVRGRVLQAEGPRAPRPPGVARLPRAGEIVVSPALRELLDGPRGDELRTRLGNARVTGTIGKAGLDGPGEAAFYLGSDRLADQPVGPIRRIDRFGSVSPPSGLDPALLFLVAIGIVASLVPVVIFIATAVRFGGEQRDRRLAALRLVGADTAMVRRIAGGESLAAALAGLVGGAAVFLVGRAMLDDLTLLDISVYGSDLTPAPLLGALAVLLVPVTAVLVTVAALRRVVIEPLGVTRRAKPIRRRLWWRMLPLVGAALLASIDLGDGGTRELWLGGAGATLVLVGVATIMPWAVEALVGRLPGRTVPLQLAVRRLQLDNTAASQVVSGIAVAVAAAIALHTLYAATEDDYTSVSGVQGGRAWFNVFPDRTSREDADAFQARLARVGGVQDQAAYGLVSANAADGNPIGSVVVVSCTSIRRLAAVERCRDGDTFLQPGGEPGVPKLTPGARVTLGDVAADGSTAGLPRWTVPRDTPTVRPHERLAGVVRVAFDWSPGAVLATPGALPRAAVEGQRVIAWVAADEGAPDIADRVRDAAAGTGPMAVVDDMTGGTETTDDFASVRLGLLGAAVGVLGLIGVSLLVTLLEQLRERRRALAALVAFGTRRATLGWSVLWQTALPVGAGLVVATTSGIGLGLLLLSMAGEPLAVDLAIVGLLTGAATTVVLAVTALSLPVLWRLMREDGLRTE